MNDDNNNNKSDDDDDVNGNNNSNKDEDKIPKFEDSGNRSIDSVMSEPAGPSPTNKRNFIVRSSSDSSMRQQSDPCEYASQSSISLSNSSDSIRERRKKDRLHNNYPIVVNNKVLNPVVAATHARTQSQTSRSPPSSILSAFSAAKNKFLGWFSPNNKRKRHNTARVYAMPANNHSLDHSPLERANSAQAFFIRPRPGERTRKPSNRLRFERELLLFPRKKPARAYEYEDVHDSIRLYQRPSHSSIQHIYTLFFNITIDDLSAYIRHKRIHKSMKKVGRHGKRFRRRVNYGEERSLLRKTRTMVAQSPLVLGERTASSSEEFLNNDNFSLGSSSSATSSMTTMKSASISSSMTISSSRKKRTKSVHFGEISDIPCIHRASSTRSILKPPSDIRETWGQAVFRVIREKEAQMRKYISILSKGLTLMLCNGDTMQKVFIIVNKSGEEFAWGKKRARVIDMINKRTTMFSFFKPAGTLRFLAEVEKLTYGAGINPNFKTYIKSGGQPYLCFTVHFSDLEVSFACENERELSNCFLGIQSLIPLYPSYVTEGQFLWNRARIKLVEKTRAEQSYRRDIVDRLFNAAREAVRQERLRQQQANLSSIAVSAFIERRDSTIDLPQLIEEDEYKDDVDDEEEKKEETTNDK